MAGVTTLEKANQYLADEYLVWWELGLTVMAAQVETRQIHNSNYTFRMDGAVYRIKRKGIVTGLRGATVRVEKRLNGTLAVRY